MYIPPNGQVRFPLACPLTLVFGGTVGFAFSFIPLYIFSVSFSATVPPTGVQPIAPHAVSQRGTMAGVFTHTPGSNVLGRVTTPDDNDNRVDLAHIDGLTPTYA